MTPLHPYMPTPLLWAAARAARALPGTRALGLARDWRDFAHLREADAALVSFPKSGRTFVRVMLARLYQSRYGHPETELLEFKGLTRSGKRLPRLLFTHDGDAMRPAEAVATSKGPYRHCKVALLARHPADVAVSRYHHLRHRSDDPARKRLSDQPLDSFVWTGKGGVPAIVAFMNAWATAKKEPRDFAIFRFEDFRHTPHPTLAALARFVGLDCTDEEISDAVEFARFENLREREREGYFKSDRLGARKPGEEGSAKVRSGKAGGYRGVLTPEQCERIDAYVAERLDQVFGYGETPEQLAMAAGS
jgi:hypothetical protein